MIKSASERIAQLSPVQRRLLEAKLRAAAPRAASQIPRRHPDRPIPVSFAQRGLWFLDRLAPGSAAYNNANTIRLIGDLNENALRRSLNEIVRRHDALRMRFESSGGEPFVSLMPAVDLDFPLIDFSSRPGAERWTLVDRLAVELARRPFDLEKGPLFRLSLLRLSEREHVLVYVVHHIASDRWSLRLFARELAEGYDALVAGGPLPVELPIGYADFAVWQRDVRARRGQDEHREYWRTRLGPQPTVFELPGDKPRPPIQTHAGATHEVELPRGMFEALNDLSRSHDATMFMTLLATFQALLYRYTGQERTVIGTPVAARSGVELENLIGLFVNVLPVLTEVRGEMRFDELLARTRAAALEVLTHQDAPLDALVEDLRISRDPGRSPLFQIVFNYHNVPGSSEGSTGLAMEIGEVDCGISRFDLTLTLRPNSDRLTASFEYNRDLFNDDTIQQLADRYRTMLEGVLADPGTPIRDLPPAAIERRTLPEPAQSKSEPDNSFVAPRTPLERRLTEEWQKLLGVSPIGVRDNFFHLGGHSLLAARFVTIIEKGLGKHLRVIELFQSPTIEQLASLLAEKEPLQSLEQQASPREVRLEPHVRNIIEEEINAMPRKKGGHATPLSFPQQRLWFLDRLEPGSSLYNISAAIRIEGDLDIRSLNAAFETVVARHESLRTVFVEVDGKPTQVVKNPGPLEMPVQDLSALHEDQREAEVMRLAQEEADLVFDLSQGPLFRVRMLALGRRTHVLLITMHHIVSDGWSVAVLFREVEILYGDFVRGNPSSLAELPVQYGDFAVWQRESLDDLALEGDLAYWIESLKGAPPFLSLPADRPRPATQTESGAGYSFTLSPGLSAAIQALCRREKSTLFMMLLAAFNVLLHRYSGEDDIVVGSPIANRNRVELENLIGFFVNTLVLRTDLSANPTFRELLQRVRKTALSAYAHQDLPFEKLVDELHPRRDASFSPLFQVMFSLQNLSKQTLDLPGLTSTRFSTGRRKAKFDLTLFMSEETGGLRGTIEFNTDLFDQSTIHRLAGHFETLLQGIVADPDRSIGSLSLLSANERNQILSGWNQTQTDYRESTSVCEFFERQVERSPHAIAVVCMSSVLTYGDLNRRANQLAHHLRNLGVAPGVMVGICMERSPEMLIALLGVLKAGGAYLPLDSSYPKDRLKLMLEDARVAVLLTTQESQRSLPSHSARTVCLDSDWPAIGQGSSTNPGLRPDEDAIAYLLYTSGSTGKPKGVQIPHRALTNFLISMQHEPGLTAKDTILAITSLSFDIAVLELLLPLCVGARLILVSREMASDGVQIQEILQEHQVTVMQATPITWRLLVEAGWQGKSNLKIICGGEALSPVLAGMLLERASVVWNCYGPTETTIYSLIHRVDAVGGDVPIGRPIANTRVYVLDVYRQPVPIGASGELYIGGSGLAKGYLGRPELTAEKFIEDPFNPEPGSRLYRSGDLARYRPDGIVEFLGRIDHQIKLRGFRIELGEIESVLGLHPAVRQAVVTLREDSPGDQRLIAYLVCHEASSPPILEFRKFLGTKLPDYMIPSGFVFLEALPVTPNGKVDRKSLPAPVQGPFDPEESYVAPRTPVEQVVARIWGEILKLERVSIVDNFFDAGGRSLLATQVVSRIRSVLRVDLAVRRLFEAPTVEQLTRVILAEDKKPGQVEKIARIVVKVAAMSAEDASRILEEKRNQSSP